MSARPPTLSAPRPRLALSAYSSNPAPGRVDLHLDANEGPGLGLDVARVAADLSGDAARCYPDASGLEHAIAARFEIEPRQVVVTAGGDDAIARACAAFLGPGRELVLPTPTFEMIARGAQLAGAEVREVSWTAPGYPMADVIAQRSERTAMVAVVSPNNPTGAVASTEELRALAVAFPHALILVDLAYAEFADEDLTPIALALPNALVVRTFSKAFGLAGLRVGYALGAPSVINALRAVGSPYPVSGPSLAVAEQAWSAAPWRLPAVIARIRAERAALADLIESVGALAHRSQANFVLAEFDDADRVWRALADRGIAVRRFTSPALAACLRITCPGEHTAFERLASALRQAHAEAGNPAAHSTTEPRA